MSSVLYYSKYCENCKLLLYELGKSNLQNDIHFLSIDRRIEKKGQLFIVLDNGRIVEFGNHSNLLSKGGVYKDLYDSQLKREKNKIKERDLF